MAVAERVLIEERTEVASRVETVTPETAATWLSTDLYQHQRPLRKWHVAEYATEMVADRFTPGTTLKFGVVDGRRYLIDGQHRLHAVIRADVPQTFVVVEIPFPSMKALKVAYDREDTGIKRLSRESATFQQYAQRHEFTTTATTKLVAACSILIYGFQSRVRKGGNVLPVERLSEVAEQFSGEFRAYLKATEHAKPAIRKYLNLGGVIAVGLITFRDQPEKAKPFWERIAALGGYEKDSGEAYLVGFFLGNVGRRLWGPEVSRYVARAWNAYYEGERITVYRQQDPSRPIRIAGTHYNGRDIRTL